MAYRPPTGGVWDSPVTYLLFRTNVTEFEWHERELDRAVEFALESQETVEVIRFRPHQCTPDFQALLSERRDTLDVLDREKLERLADELPERGLHD